MARDRGDPPRGGLCFVFPPLLTAQGITPSRSRWTSALQGGSREDWLFPRLVGPLTIRVPPLRAAQIQQEHDRVHQEVGHDPPHD